MAIAVKKKPRAAIPQLFISYSSDQAHRGVQTMGKIMMTE
ncbi:hypothetical protein CHCC14600_1488 [Bacillus licheniformis]|uniref:TIR domain-containing protein n=1 Tax=Bacillus paralicheniformis TaxID=1648923 RepID=A0ABY3FV22_9BACI|nr:hypothetical protein LI17339_15330 [Bacillus licheniformis LMG 17339]OLF88313.1 hypothetical protein B4094_3927 [Bacillus licheniformis]TWJ56676.1 hypothetical protein CHCC5022_3796 [Bacillus paralicheniformis]TWJ84454.1 hypothetical protein CHCC4186_4572 [Bacillus paralicheniformis]TWJ93838.1 hypothetical protein CHCC20495_1835 [Bacillus licheniformis]